MDAFARRRQVRTDGRAGQKTVRDPVGVLLLTLFPARTRRSVPVGVPGTRNPAPVEATTTWREPTCYDATSGPGTRRRVCPSARSPTGVPARGRGPGGAAVASSGDGTLSRRTTWSVDAQPAWSLVGAYSVATPVAGRTTVHEGPRDPYDYRTTSVYPNAKQDAYYREFVSHLSQPICPCALTRSRTGN